MKDNTKININCCDLRIRPPKFYTYKKEGNYVFVSKFHGKDERNENLRMAMFLGEKTKDVVYVLPHIQPTLTGSDELRSKFFPQGVKKGKNPDFYFKGRFVDGKNMTSIKESCSQQGIFTTFTSNTAKN